MFILRKVYRNGDEVNEILGDSYSLIHKMRNNDLWEAWIDKRERSVFGVIITKDGQQELHQEIKYYVMTPDGHTFDNLSLPEVNWDNLY